MFKIFKRLKRKEIILILISIVFIVIQVFLNLRLIDYMAEITTLVQTPGSELNEIIREGLWMMACALGSLVSAFVVSYCAAIVSASVAKNLRKNVFQKVNDFGMEEIKSFSTGSLITRSTNDIRQVSTFVFMSVQLLVQSPLMAIMAIMKIYDKGWEFTLTTVVGVGVILITVIIMIIVVLPKFNRIQKLTDELNKVTKENLNGIRVVRAFNAEKYQTDRFEDANDILTKDTLFTHKAFAFLFPLITAVMLGVTLATYWIGAYLINDAAIYERVGIFSNMIVFSSYAMQVISSFLMLVMIFILYPRSQVSANRINEVLDKEIRIKNGTVLNGKKGKKGTVQFKKVSFQYPDAESPILKDISFDVKQGQTVAFIGSTGSGKSTLINLIPRFYDCTSGEIIIDGVNVKDYDINYLNDKIGYIPQKATIFKGSIKDNVSFGKKTDGVVTFDDVKTGVEVAQGKDFVENLKDQYDHELASGGTNVSGGQKQRLSIARAIARNPEIYIFDDTFSALDYKTDLSLRTALKKHTKEATIFIVAQRIGTIKDADLIIVLDEGYCVGKGRHDELMKSCEVYKEIALSQLSQEELDNA